MFEARLDSMVNFRSDWPAKGLKQSEIYLLHKFPFISPKNCTRAETGSPEGGSICLRGHAGQKAKLTASSQPFLLHSSGATRSSSGSIGSGGNCYREALPVCSEDGRRGR